MPTTLSETSPDADLVTLDGLRFPTVWLRDNCACADCQDPLTHQKLFGITDLAADVAVSAMTEEPDDIRIVFAPDGHQSVFARAWLAAHALEPSPNAPDPTRSRATLAGANPQFDTDQRTEADKQLWRAADLARHLPEADWSDYQTNPSVQAASLEYVLRLGFVLLHGVPTTPGAVLQVVETFGFVRETNYGRLFDVRVEVSPNNLAFTNLPITPHTDNPYRDPVPTLQLLHCLTSAAEGGDSGLVDGFLAAALLRELHPDAFDILTHTPVPFAFRDRDTELRACGPIIEVDPRGDMREVRFSNRHVQPIRLAPQHAADFYRAYRQFAALAYDPELQLTFKLDPGDCIIFDNTRVLHARTAFASGGARHLQGAYADLDSLASTLAVLRRLLNPLKSVTN